LKQRVLTAALLIPPVLLAVFLSNFVVLWVLAAVATFIGFRELQSLSGAKPRGFPVLGWLLIACAFPFHLPIRRMDSLFENGYYPLLEYWGKPIGGAILCFILSGAGVSRCLWIIRGGRTRVGVEIASLWIAAPLAAMVLLKMPYQPEPSVAEIARLDWGGPYVGGPVWDWCTPVLLCLVPLWIGDTLAIFVGRAFGKHLLAPKISPKKTVEGGVANLVGCIAGAIGIAYLIHQPMLVGALTGVATGVLGQAGDLLESAMKRAADVKDSGNLLPGHGGLLDRIDSILLSAPVVALIVVTLGSR
jgi:CDP-diglyceride synthetase